MRSYITQTFVCIILIAITSCKLNRSIESNSGPSNDTSPSPTSPTIVTEKLEFEYSDNTLLNANNSQTLKLSVKGGTPPYTYQILSGPGSIDTNTGVYQSSFTPGDTIVEVNDSLNSKLQITIKSLRNYTNGPVHDVLIDNGSLILAGQFTAANPHYSPYLAKFNLTSGQFENVFYGLNGEVNDFVILDDESIIAVGLFTKYKNVDANYIVKIDKNGKIDTSFNSGTGFSTAPLVITKYQNSIFVGGNFTTYNGLTTKYLVKLNQNDGSVDSTFNMGIGYNGIVKGLEIYSDKLYVIGNHNSYDSVNISNISKLDAITGQLDTSFSQSNNMSSTAVHTIKACFNQIFVGGNFFSYRGSSVKNLVKLDPVTGNLDPAYNTTLGTDSSIYSLECGNGTDLYIGGIFNYYKGATTKNIVKINHTDGTRVGTFDLNQSDQLGVNNLLLDGSNIHVVGDFKQISNNTSLGYTNINATTGSFNLLEARKVLVSDNINQIKKFSDYIIVGGKFFYSGGSPVSNIVKLDSQGSLDSSFTKIDAFNNVVNRLHINGTNLIASGAFTMYEGAINNYVTELSLINGSADTSFATNASIAEPMSYMCTNSLGLYISENGFSDNIYKLNLSTGVKDIAFTPPVIGNTIRGISCDDSGIFVPNSAGTLKKLNPNTGNVIASFETGGGINSHSVASAIGNSSLYVISTSNTQYRGVDNARFYKVDLNTGAPDSAFMSTNGFSSFFTWPNSLNLSADESSIYFFVNDNLTYRGQGGHLFKINALDGSLDPIFNHGLQLSTGGKAYIVKEISGKLYLGGDFTSYNSKNISYFTVIDALTGL